MPAEMTEAEFSKHLNTKFHVGLEGETVDLELTVVKGYSARPGDQEGLERFSIFFSGPARPVLPQRTYSLSHEAMGTFDIFLVPVKPDGEGSRYEAVFNYFKK